MVRKTPEQRLAELADAAIDVFSRHGFDDAQIVDIARTAGVSVGTVYNYVADKESLLLVCIEREFLGGLSNVGDLPLTRPAGDLLTVVEKRLDELVRFESLERALRAGPPEDPVAVLGAVAGELFDLIEGTRRGADALERSAAEIPEVAALFFFRVRSRLIDQFAVLLGQWGSQGVIPAREDAELAARLALETLTWGARHRFRDFEAQDLDRDAVRAQTIQFVIGALT